MLLAAPFGCGGGSGGDGDAEIDGDTDSDADTDSDTDTDVDGDADDDADADLDDAPDTDISSDADNDIDRARDGDTDVDADADIASCREIAREFRDALDDVTHCDEDRECVAHDFGAPVIADCYTAVHGEADLTEADRLAEEWHALDCDTREHSCEPEPPSEAVCTLTHRCRFMGEEYVQCEEHRRAFREEAERLNHCGDVSDCFLVVVLDCGIMAACWIPINGGEDQTHLREIEREYGIVHCPYATCSCPLPRLECQDDRCVEIYD